MLPEKNIRYGLVLEGGGAKGAYEIGVWKALRELEIEISAVVGTSIGSLNGALFVQGDYEEAVKIWENIKYSSIINVEDDLIQKLKDYKWSEVSIHESGQQFLEIIRNRGFDITPLKQMIEEMMDEERVRSSDIDFGLVTFNVSDFKPLELMINDIEEGQLSGYLLASSYLPSFKTEKIFGKRFIDGAFHSVVPTSMLVDRGYKNIIEVRIQGVGREQSVKDDEVNIIKIEAKEDLGGVLELDPERVKRNMKLGYYDTLKIFEGYAGEHYYIIAPEKESTYLKQFLRLPFRKIEYLITCMGGKHQIKNYTSKARLVCEILIPLVSRKLRLKTEHTYREIYIALLENFAGDLEVERFKIYTVASFQEAIDDEFRSLDKNLQKVLLRNDHLVELAVWLGL